MKKLVNVLIIVAAISLVLGLISRVTLVPFPRGLVARSFAQFTDTCLFFAIALLLLVKK